MMAIQNVKWGGALLLLALSLAACSGGRDVTGGTAVFRALIEDPVPPGISDIASTGLLAGEEGSGHIVYLRFRVTPDYVDALITARRFEPVGCADDFVRGNLTLSQGLESDIVDWNPFNGDPANRCYATGRSYTNQWTRGARGMFLYQPATGYVYYNELGL
ncbi:MAG: hypothetical protein ACOCXZ_00045 [Chloroflexota bacterium]